MKNILSENTSLVTIKNCLSIPLIISMALLLIFFALFNIPEKKDLPKVKNGLLELDQWNFEKDGKLALDGKWEFYWNHLLLPEDFKNNPDIKGSLINVPGYWNEKTLKTNAIKGNGYSTYRLNIHTTKKIKDISIKVDAIFSAYTLWIGEKQVLACGTVGSSSGTSQAGMEALIGFYQFPGDGGTELSITIHASNFIGGNGGILKSIYIGTPKQIQNFREKNLMIENFQTAITLYMGLFFLLLFFIGKRETYCLYFGILCILVSLRGLFLGELAIYTIFSGYDPEVFYKMSFIILCLTLLAFVMYYHKVFPYEIKPILIRATLIIGMIFNTIALIVPYRLLYHMVFVFEIFALLIFIMLAKVTVQIVKKKLAGHTVMVLGSVIVFLSSVNDVLSDLHIFRGWLNITTGVFIFLILLTFLLIKRYANTLKMQELFYKSEIDMLQAQIKPHFIFNVINTISYFTGKDVTKAQSLLQDLANHLRNSFSFKNSNELIELEEEISNLRSYLNLEEARFSGKLKVIFDIPQGLSAKIPSFLLQPIVENALKHGILPKEEGGHVKISAALKHKCLLISIEDDGVGMSEERLRGLLDENIEGYGLGVRNVNKRLKHQFGNPLRVESTEGKGTSFSMEIPQ
ncbi:MAG: signal transduction histidine kinase, LytS [Eubacterium sp.]|nr:signal transduction histidine kinase, LytS [Eubacterium sp.]